MTTEKEILDRLNLRFPDKVIYRDEYVSDIINFEVFQIAKSLHISGRKWLTQNGFVWKETGYIEKDMKCGAVLLDDYPDISCFAEAVIKCYPLIGSIILSSVQEKELFKTAQAVFKRILLGQSNVSAKDQCVLVLETVQLLKKWVGEESSDDGENSSMWKYIFTQYGFNPENDSASATRAYKGFQHAIKSALIANHRFFAPEGTQRYYTTLMLHALAPVQSIENLYNILFSFYEKNLDYQYIPDDTSYRSFVRAMNARSNSNIYRDDNYQLRSDAVASGLRALFATKPGFMAVTCDNIVKKIDAILRNQSEDVINAKTNYWDKLLLDWYFKKSNAVRNQLQRTRTNKQFEQIATKQENICPQYIITGKNVCIFLPQIRLGEAVGTLPVLTIKQAGQDVYHQKLSVYGDDICLTSNKCVIPLSNFNNADFSRSFNFEINITFGSEIIYRSEDKLFRTYLSFDSQGREKAFQSIKTSMALLFIPENDRVEFYEDSEKAHQIVHCGQLLEINLTEIHSLRLNGKELYVDIAMKDSFRQYYSAKKIDGCKFLFQGQEYDIFDKEFELRIHFPDGESCLKYLFSVNDVTKPMSEVCCADATEFMLRMSKLNDPCRIQISEFSTGKIVFESQFIIIPKFRFTLDKPIYPDCNNDIRIIIDIDSCSEERYFQSKAGDTSICIPILSNYGLCEINLPKAKCTFMGENIFQYSRKAIWYKAISNSEFILPELPTHWSAELYLGHQRIAYSTIAKGFEIGNALYCYHTDSHQSEPLILKLNGPFNYCTQWTIVTIAFTEHFDEAPLEVVDGVLNWNPENNYLGSPESEFKIDLYKGDELFASYKESINNEVIERHFPLDNGFFKYEVFVKKKTAFETKQDRIYSGRLTVGNPDEFLFEGKTILFKSASCWNWDTQKLETEPLVMDAGLAKNIVFKGYSIADGETQTFPRYEATLYFYNKQSGRLVPFNSNDNPNFELINPVGIWIINDHMLSLRTVTEDAVSINTRHNTIVNRKDQTPFKYQREYVKTPDYFEYETIE